MKTFALVIALIISACSMALADPAPCIQVLSSGTATAAGALVQIAGTPNRTLFLTGFTLSSGTVVAPVSGVVTTNGVSTQLNWTYSQSVASGGFMSIIFPGFGIQAAAMNGSVQLNIPAIAGGSAITYVMYGCYQ